MGYNDKKYHPKRIIVYLSIDVQLNDHSNIKWKEYFVDPQLIESKQILIKNVIIESCINWNNILLKRKENLDKYHNIKLYYKLQGEYQDDGKYHTITSTVR